MTLKKFLFGEENKEDVAMDETESKDEKKLAIGKIIYIESEKGWGFITSPDVKFTRVFFHWTALQSDTLNFAQLKKGMRVQFIPITLDGRVRAIKIRVIDNGSSESKDSGN